MTDIYTVGTEPTGYPVTLDEVKLFSKITNTVEDDLLDGLIAAATNIIEEYLHRWFLTRTDVVGEFDSIRISNSECFSFLEVRRSPLISVASVEVFDNDAYTVLTVDDDYEVKRMSSFSRILIYDSISADYEKAYPLKVTFDAGFGDIDDVPEAIKVAIKQMVNYLYLNRGDCVPNCGGGGDRGSFTTSVPLFIAAPIAKYRILNTFAVI